LEPQTTGLIGKLVDGMIRRSVRKAFHTVRWIPPSAPVSQPAIFVPNHHGWHDGYLMYVALTRLGYPFLDWITEYDAFPLFGKVGGMRFPRDDAAARAATIRQTIRMLQAGKKNLLLFAESELHYPSELLPFGDALGLIAKKVPGVAIIPVAIRYEMAFHERPEAFLTFGPPVEAGPRVPERTRLAVRALLDETALKVRHRPEAFQTLLHGTKDVNERWDMRNIPGAKKR